MAASEVSIQGYSEPSDGSRPVSETGRSSSGVGIGNLSDLFYNMEFSGEFSYLCLFLFTKLMLIRRCTRSFGVHVPVHL